jgi:hypothetical protein
MTRRLLTLLLVLSSLSACVPPTMYEWGRYEDSLYAYYRDTDQMGLYMEALGEVIEGAAKTRIGPGLHAEYGFLLFERGRTAEAIRQFEREKEKWPESERFMDVLIRLARGESLEKIGHPLTAPQDVQTPQPAATPVPPKAKEPKAATKSQGGAS